MRDGRRRPGTGRPVLAPPSLDVWHFNVQAINYHGDYVSIAAHLSGPTLGDLTFDRIVDHSDTDSKIAWIELTRAGRTEHHVVSRVIQAGAGISADGAGRQDVDSAGEAIFASM